MQASRASISLRAPADEGSGDDEGSDEDDGEGVGLRALMEAEVPYP